MWEYGARRIAGGETLFVIRGALIDPEMLIQFLNIVTRGHIGIAVLMAINMGSKTNEIICENIMEF